MLNTALIIIINSSVVQVGLYFTGGYVNNELEGVERKEKNKTAAATVYLYAFARLVILELAGCKGSAGLHQLQWP
jgi:hypothetical protein